LPTTLAGLLIAIIFLTPGFVHYVQRRRQVPQRELSGLVELATLTTTSVATNAVALGVFAAIRNWWPNDTPNPEKLLLDGTQYAAPHLGLLILWGIAFVVFSTGLALLVGRRPRWLRWLLPKDLFPGPIVDVSAWYQAFDQLAIVRRERPPSWWNNPERWWRRIERRWKTRRSLASKSLKKRVFLGLDLRDGSYVSGYLDWFSTDINETADRDVMLAAPITLIRNGLKADVEFERILVSARDIVRIFVDYLSEEGAPGSVT
jgi:hypothetical protein